MRQVLPKSPAHIALGALVFRRKKELLAMAALDALAAEEERGRVGHTRGLLHAVRHDHDGVIVLELRQHLFDLRRADRIERRARIWFAGLMSTA